MAKPLGESPETHRERMSTQSQDAAKPAPRLSRPTTVTPFPAPEGVAARGPSESAGSPERTFSPFGSINQFRDAQQMATVLAHSSIVPENYREEGHLGDCLIAREIANRIGALVLAVMQDLCLVRGKSEWSAQFLISCLNASGRFPRSATG